MTAPTLTADALKLDGFVRHYRGMAPVRMGMVACLMLLLATVASPAFTVSFSVLHFGLYATLFWAVEVAERDEDAALDVREDQVVATPDARDVERNGPKALAHAVPLRVLTRVDERLGLDVDADRARRAAQERAHRQDAAAAPDGEHAGARHHASLERREREARRLVGARSERDAGIDDQRHVVRLERGRLPRGVYDEVRAHA